MPFVTVRVGTPRNRLIYVNGAYTQAAGNSSTDTFELVAGGYRFETLTGDKRVDYRKKFRVSAEDEERTIDLDPIDPPEET
ncbi:MAG: hypothetical protein JNL04_05145 [Rhodospirillaceae bacterium]|nr:hypothetical protein [Rhodospirillaceae bacterium]